MSASSRSRWLRRLAIGTAKVGAGFFVLLLVLFFTFKRQFWIQPTYPQLPAPADRAAAVRQDLEVLAQYPTINRTFTPQSAAQFESERVKLAARADKLTPAMLEMEVSRLVTLADNGHSQVGRQLQRLPLAPVRLAWFEEGLFIVRAAPAHAELVGSQVLGVNGKSADELLAALRPYVGGPDERVKDQSTSFIASPFALAGIWPEMDAARATYRLRNAQGETREVVLEALPPAPKAGWGGQARNLAPQPIEGETGPWATVLSTDAGLPMALENPDDSLFVKALDDDKGLYLHIVTVLGDKNGALDDQLKAVLDKIQPGSLRYAILDLRFNGGGNYMLTADFTKELPKRIAADGRLFILTDNATFSAAIVTFARARYFAGARSRVIGEHVGDRERFWGEGSARLELPNSKIVVNNATGLHDWGAGCGWADISTCYWVNFFHDVPAGKFTPDREVKWKFTDYREKRDTVLEAALAEARLLKP